VRASASRPYAILSATGWASSRIRASSKLE
jgi:hypothetical protein